MKKLIAVLLALTLVLSLAACGGGEKAPEADKDAQPVVYFCISHMTNAWAANAQATMEAEAKEQGAKLTVLVADQDINKQVGQIEQAVTNGADAVIIEPVSAEGVLSAVKAAREAGVTVIIYNQNISDPTQADTFVGVSNEDMGYMEMKAACEEIGGSGNIVLLLGPLGSEGQIGRSAGYEKALKEYPDVKVVYEEDAQWTTDDALKLVENWISTGVTIDAVVSQNDNMALGAVKAFEDANMSVPCYGVDAVDDAITAISNGRLCATVDQSTGLQSKLAIAAAIKAFNNEKLDAQYLAEPILIDSTNVSEYTK